MARSPRSQLPDGVYHITSRGNRGQVVFTDELDFVRFLKILDKVVARCGWQCSAYCLMTNHFHLLVETTREALSSGMEVLNGRYAQRFNLRHDLRGHVFEGRFRSWMIESNWHFIHAARYIVLNPLRAGLCSDPGDWAWSSYQAMIGTSPIPPSLRPGGLLGHFGRDAARSRASFAAFVAEGIGDVGRGRAWP